MTSSARLQQEANAAARAFHGFRGLKSSVTTTAITNGAMTFAKEGSSAVAAPRSTARWPVPWLPC